MNVLESGHKDARQNKRSIMDDMDMKDGFNAYFPGKGLGTAVGLEVEETPNIKARACWMWCAGPSARNGEA
ncbi:MAG: hypothetical protein ABR903_10805 [Thermodesulfovibrionales bacterium]|jgi:hypothetical protein